MGTRNPIGGPFHRRVRRPFGKFAGQRRPVRWIEGNSSHGVEPLPVANGFSLTPTLDTSLWPTAGGTELIFGDEDLDWMDANEATTERIVGNIDVLGANLLADGSNYVRAALFRLGLITVQEVEDISTWVPPSLWDREALEEYEWMWLYQGTVVMTNPGGDTNGNNLFGSAHIDVDSSIRRKIGKKDHIVLLGQFALTGALTSDLVISAYHCLRVLFKTK